MHVRLQGALKEFRCRLTLVAYITCRAITFLYSCQGNPRVLSESPSLIKQGRAPLRTFLQPARTKYYSTIGFKDVPDAAMSAGVIVVS